MNIATILRLEQEAVRIYEETMFDPSKPVRAEKICRALFGSPPETRARLPREALSGVVNGEVRIFVRAGTTPRRRRWLQLHEAAHNRLGTNHGVSPERERECDLLAACLVAPRPAVERALRKCGHRVYELAEVLDTTQALAMLRIGEVVGRPVRLHGRVERIRGDWSEAASAHPIRLLDEGKWGAMMNR